MTAKLEVSGLSYSYHSMDGETQALSNISFTVDTGEFIAIVGPSGCGKSTLLSIFSGLLKPDEGEILIDPRRPPKVLCCCTKARALVFERTAAEICSSEGGNA